MAKQNVFWTFSYQSNTCPCRYCEERTVDCHGKCPKYKEWQENKPKNKTGFLKEGYYK